MNIYTQGIYYDSNPFGFRQDIMVDGYMYSINVYMEDFHSLSLELDYLFYTPKMTGIPNIENMTSWCLKFRDHNGSVGEIQKTGDDLCIMLPRYHMICTTITDGMDFLTKFNRSVKELMKHTYPAACDYTQMVQ